MVVHYGLSLNTKNNRRSLLSKMVVDDNELSVLLRSNTVTKGNVEEPRVYYILCVTVHARENSSGEESKPGT